MRILVFSLLLLCLSPVSAVAGLGLKDCSRALDSADVMRCLNTQYEAGQDILNEVFNGLLSQKGGEALLQVKEIQAHWLEYRTLECAQETKTLESEALKRLEMLRCMNRLTQERIAALQNALENDGAQAIIGEAAAQPRWMNVLAEDYPDVFWRYGGRISADMDCDGEDEYVMSGLAFDPQEIDYKTVVSISENPATGRPQSFVLETPRRAFPPQDGADSNAQCFGLVDFVFEPGEDNNGADEEGEALDEGVDMLENKCQNRLVVKDEQIENEIGMCREHVIFWDGQVYVLDQ